MTDTPVGNGPAEILHNAIAAPLHRPGGPLDKLAREFVQWSNNDRYALEAGFPLTFPWYWGALEGWWERYDRAWHAETQPSGPPPASVRPRLAQVADDRLRTVIEGNAAAARVVKQAAQEVAKVGSSWLPWIAIGLGAVYLLSRGAK